MRIYLWKNRANFHPDQIWNNGALGFLKSVPKQHQVEEEQREDEWRYGISSWLLQVHFSQNTAVKWH